VSRECQGSLYCVLSRTSSNHPCSPSMWSLNLHLLLAMSPYLARAVSSLSRRIAGLSSRKLYSRSPTFSLSVHVADNDQILLVETHAFLTFQPLDFVKFSLLFWLVDAGHNTNTVNPFILPPYSAGTGDPYEVTKSRRSEWGSPCKSMHRPRQGFRQGDHSLAYPPKSPPCAERRRC